MVMRKAKMPLDKNSEAIQVLAIDQFENIISGNQSTILTDTEQETVIRLCAITDGAYIKIGTNPTAADGDGFYLPGGAVEYFRVEKGEVVSVFGDTVNLSTTK